MTQEKKIQETMLEDDVTMLRQLVEIDHRGKIDRTEDYTSADSIRKAARAMAELIEAKAQRQKEVVKGEAPDERF